MRKGLALLTAFAAIACAPAPLASPTYAPERPRRFHGRYSVAFEASSFEGCWLNMSGQPYDQMRRRHPEIEDPRVLTPDTMLVFEVTFDGVRHDRSGDRTSFGHMGLYPCEIDVVRLIYSRRLPNAE